MENSERLGRQVQPEFEPGTFRLPVLSVTAEPLVGLLRLRVNVRDIILKKNFENCGENSTYIS